MKENNPPQCVLPRRIPFFQTGQSVSILKDIRLWLPRGLFSFPEGLRRQRTESVRELTAVTGLNNYRQSYGVRMRNLFTIDLKNFDINGTNYIHEVKAQTEKILCALSYSDLKKKVSAERRKELESLNVVSTDESAAWLVDYWCGKDFRGLVQMPFSRHWIMHIEAALRIAGKLRK